MTIAYYDNPAKRLLNILNKAVLVGEADISYYAWRKILNLPSETTDVEVSLAIGKVISLVAEINSYLVANEPEYVKDCQYWMDNVLHALAVSSSLSSAWRDVLIYLDNHTFSYLRSVVRIIDSNMLKEQILHLDNVNQEELLEINSSVKSLYEEILNNQEIDPKVKASILKYLSKLIEAVDQYAITGSEGILEALEQAVGHMCFNPDYKNYMEKTVTGKKTLTMMGEIAKKVTCVTGVIELLNNGVTLVEHIKKMV